jgi:hypothetical protein
MKLYIMCMTEDKTLAVPQAIVSRRVHHHGVWRRRHANWASFRVHRPYSLVPIPTMAQRAWSSGYYAFAACSKQDLPDGAAVQVFTSSRSYHLYEEAMDDANIYNVRLLSEDKNAVPVAAADLAAHSLWFRAYLRNR